MKDSKLRQLVAQFWKIDINEVDDRLLFDATRLKGMSSIRFYRFIAAVESNWGIKLSDPASITSYFALRNAIAAAHTPQSGNQEDPRFADHQRWEIVSIGHDIEEIASLPDVEDFSADSFYTKHFTLGEIAWCARLANPRQHFAVRFCAKEALRKCADPFRELEPAQIEVVNDAMGKPKIVIHDESVNRVLGPSTILVSLTHTEMIASAIVLVVRFAS